MNIKEVAQQAKEGDHLKVFVCGIPQNFKMQNRQILTMDGRHPVYMLDHYINDWQIIPAKKEPVSAREWRDRDAPHLPMEVCDLVWGPCEKNRDLLYAELVDLVSHTEYLHSDGLRAIHNEIDKIKEALG